ncbi:Metallo-dependent phosphatase [Irpex rosettiformis]|uniref:Metallo-dependent phosphatase n=1 Tax=Irpex rosettiformis TaxID=378272 RepID=A0ACB8U2Z9_9APHY|nr:Metallo-dependent phosphatase [Irpex rosettiformis]
MYTAFSTVISLVYYCGVLTVVRAAPAVDPRVLALPSSLNPYPAQPRITFRPDGTFKLTVFSDLHYGENAWDVWGPQQDVNSSKLMKRVLADEKPDFVVLNGDLITGENTFKENSTVYIDEIVSNLNDAQIPFSSTYGNHDNNPNITHMAEFLREKLVSPHLSYTRILPSGGIYGPGNYWVPVYARASDFVPALILWAFDSRAGNTAGQNSTQVPDWVDDSVATWIENETKLMDSVWGPPGDQRAAVAFVHIPPFAIQQVWENLNNTLNPGLDADSLGQGSTQATTKSSSQGNDEPFWNSLNTNVKNLHAVISGHDHGMEWCAREPTKNVIFCFDKHSGYGGYSSPGWDHGVRNILFTSPDPRDGPLSWIRLENGTTRAHVQLDDQYQ